MDLTIQALFTYQQTEKWYDLNIYNLFPLVKYCEV